MKTLSEKIKEQRAILNLNQPDLAGLVGVSTRSIAAYEKGEKNPREKTLYQLAKALKVSIKYLKDDECENPTEDIDKDPYIIHTQENYGTKDAKSVAALLSANKALFAGGDVSEEEKERFFQEIMRSYLQCKELAKKKYGRKKK